jgi:Replication-relaxation
MTTIANVGTIVTERDRELLRTLATTRVLDAEQIQVVGGFTSLRRTNRRLLKLVRAGLLKRWFLSATGGGQKAIYGLSLQGASLIGETRARVVRLPHDSLITHSEFLAHQQAVNAVFLLAKIQPLPAGLVCQRWVTIREPFSQAVPLLPDGYFEIAHGDVVYPMFLEVDLGTERAPIWQRKVELYLKFALSGEFERLFHEKRFRVLVVLPSERRLEAVRKTVARRTEKLFWFATHDDLTAYGLAARIWRRPAGTERMALV